MWLVKNDLSSTYFLNIHCRYICIYVYISSLPHTLLTSIQMCREFVCFIYHYINDSHRVSSLPSSFLFLFLLPNSFSFLISQLIYYSHLLGNLLQVCFLWVHETPFPILIMALTTLYRSFLFLQLSNTQTGFLVFDYTCL